MSGEMTLEDLAGEASLTEAASESTGEATGEWLMDFYDRMRDDGYLDPLMKQLIGETRDIAEIQKEKTGNEGDHEPDQGAEPASDLNAESIKDVMLELYDHAGAIPGLSDDPTLSELIKLIDANPDLADQLIQQYV